MKKTHIIGIIVIAVAIGVIFTTLTDSSTYASFTQASKESGSEFHVVGNALIGNSSSMPMSGYRLTVAGKLFIEGNTVIGNSSSVAATGYKLSVDGKIISEEVRVSLASAWPDYVFDRNYPLLNINDLEKYILLEKHLPNIPAAREMENGQNLGDMQRRMMEKIEELSLYIIQLEKRQNQTEKLNQLLKNRIELLEKK